MIGLVMTLQNLIEASATSGVTAVTVALALQEHAIVLPAGIPDWVITAGLAALVGWFSAQITVRSELTDLRTDLRLMRAELHRYYPTRGEYRRDKAAQDVPEDTP